MQYFEVKTATLGFDGNGRTAVFVERVKWYFSELEGEPETVDHDCSPGCFCWKVKDNENHPS